MNEWKDEACRVVDCMQLRLTALRETVEAEMNALIAEVTEDLRLCVEEFKEKATQLKPQLKSPILTALWDRESEKISLLSCQTDFNQVRNSVEVFLYSLNIQLQTEIPDYAPHGFIEFFSEINPNRKVNIYKPCTEDFCTPQSKAALKQYRELKPCFDPIPRVRRGPVVFGEGSIYMGECNSSNQAHGFGKAIYTSGAVYTGTWVHDSIEGRGIYVFNNGEIYDGEYRHGKKHGYGKLLPLYGKALLSEWVDGKVQ